jgi:hypothetical protein
MKVDNVIDALKLLVDLGLIPLEEGADKTMVELPACVVQKLIDIAYNAKQPNWRTDYELHKTTAGWVTQLKDHQGCKGYCFTKDGWVTYGWVTKGFETSDELEKAFKLAKPPSN